MQAVTTVAPWVAPRVTFLECSLGLFHEALVMNNGGPCEVAGSLHQNSRGTERDPQNGSQALLLQGSGQGSQQWDPWQEEGHKDLQGAVAEVLSASAQVCSWGAGPEDGG